METGKENGKDDPAVFVDITRLEMREVRCILNWLRQSEEVWLISNNKSVKINLSPLRPFIPNILSPGSTGMETGRGGGGGGALRGQSGQPSSENS